MTGRARSVRGMRERRSGVDVTTDSLVVEAEGSLMSRPIHVEESVTVARSPEVVWSAVADYGTTWSGARA